MSEQGRAQAEGTWPGVDAKTFKELLARYPSGVTVVTTLHDQKRHGMTVAAFSSVSLDPPLVLVCIANTASSREPIARAGCFAVHFLGSDQVHMATRFAGMVDGLKDRFDGLACTSAKTGAPILDGCMAVLDCTVEHAYPAGDHTIFVGRVVHGEVRDGGPLFYHQRTWRTLGPEAG